MSMFWEVIIFVILSKKTYMYMCPIPNGFWDRAISLYSCKIVDKEILCTFCNISIYCSSDKVGTVYLVQYIFENSVNSNGCNTITEAVNVPHIPHLWRCAALCTTLLHVTISSHNGHLTLHTNTHATYSGAVQWSEGQYWVPNPKFCTGK